MDPRARSCCTERLDPMTRADDPWRDAPHDVILCNFGGPETEADVEPFLFQLFNDPFIIRSPWIGERLRGFIARRISTKRAPKAIAEYREIGFSPINRMTNVQAAHLEAGLRALRPDTRVLVCNRYTAPTADEVVAKLRPDARTFIATLYPHLCHSTTVSSLRDLDLAMRRVDARTRPGARIFTFWQNPRYLTMTYLQVRRALEGALAKSERLACLFSAHGIPERYNRRGDPYVQETYGHFAELTRRLDAWLRAEHPRHRVEFRLAFQSRVGRMEWVKPYTDATIAELGAAGFRSLVMVPISFTADHVETLYEMDHTYRGLAAAAKIDTFARAVPANDDPELARCLVDVLVQHGF
jgi:ferrochelatase